LGAKKFARAHQPVGCEILKNSLKYVDTRPQRGPEKGMSLVMSSPANREQITLSRETIHNPDEPRHFMRIKPMPGLVRILYKGRVLAESSRALRLLEAGKDIYDPTIYLPASDLRAALSPGEKRTYCPL
jgi:hypothetical protein